MSITVMTVTRWQADDPNHGIPSDVSLYVLDDKRDILTYSTHRPIFQCKGMELPWRDNERMISCIPAGTYIGYRINQSRFGWCYLLLDVPGRSGILFGHIGNYAGDETHGYRSNSDGCLLLGRTHGVLTPPGGKSQFSVLTSGPTVSEFNKVVSEKCTEGAIIIVI